MTAISPVRTPTVIKVVATNRQAPHRVNMSQAHGVGTLQAASKGRMAKPVSVATAVLAAATRMEGMFLGKPRLERSRAAVQTSASRMR
jgi:hypothetical protein